MRSTSTSATYFGIGTLAVMFTLALAASAAGSEPGSGTREPGSGPRADEVRRVTSPTLAVVTFHADWCGTCRALDPKLDAVRSTVQDQPVLFLKLDLTNPATTRQAELLASLLKMDEGFTENRGRTGFAVLVKPDTGEVVGRLTAAQDPDEMQASIVKLISD